MSTDLKYQIDSEGSEETEQLGREIGQKLEGGEIITLSSDLGGGKTTFVRGLAAGAGSNDMVSSPSFTLANEYKTPAYEIFHYDLYRIEDLGLLKEDLAEIIADNSNVIVIEWSNLAQPVLDEQRLIKLELLVTGINSRSIEIDLPNKYKYLLDK